MGGGGGGGNNNGLFLPIFLIMKMTFDLNRFWYGVKQYQGKFVKKVMTIQLKTITQ